MPHHIVIELTDFPWPLLRSLPALELGSFGKYGRPEAASLCYLLVLLLLPEFFLRFALLDLFDDSANQDHKLWAARSLPS